jgi:uncharacterized repeat protein (TIGR03803 family)
MRPKKPFSAAKSSFVIFIMLLLALGIVPTQAQAQKFKVLHTFHGPDGANPVGQLVRDKAGNFYSTTANGGAGKCKGGCGTAFKIDKTGKEVWLHSFKGPPDASQPDAGLLRDAAGNLYGTTVYGGNTTCVSLGCGTVFKLDKTGRETRLYRFTGAPNGWFPESLLVGDPAGNLYGTTINGGTFDNGGTVFKVDKDGTETVLYSFCSASNCADGNSPYVGLIRDAAGNLYGVTNGGGDFGAGAVFRLDTTGGETVLYSFAGDSDGSGPNSVLLADSKGNLYGTTKGGGNVSCGGGDGCGILFELSPQSDGSWAKATLYTFCSLSNCTDGRYPYGGPLVLDASGNLYGSTILGGTYYRNCGGDGCGVVFKLDTTGKETVLHSFDGGAGGTYPWLGAVDASGNLYGAAGQGGDLNCAPNRGYGCGTLFRITP